MKKFTRTIEDFTCNHCNREVSGNGYTNHCPHCLWSMHVDINPGDRGASCKGMMEPIEMIVGGGEYSIVHKCNSCGFERNNKLQKEDNFETALTLLGFKNTL